MPISPKLNFTVTIKSRKKIKFAVWDYKTDDLIEKTVVEIKDASFIAGLIDTYNKKVAKLNKI